MSKIELLDVPTTLTLFNYPEPVMAKIAGQVRSTKIMGTEIAGSDAAYRRYEEVAAGRITRLTDNLERTSQALAEAVSPATATRAYLAIHDNLTGYQATPQETFGFYKACLKANNIHHENLQKATIHGGQADYINLADLIKSVTNSIERGFKGFGMPGWFRGGPDEWELFKYQNGHFYSLLNPQLGAMPFLSRRSHTSSESCCTDSSRLPDWTKRADNDPPTPDEAKQGLDGELADVTELRRIFSNGMNQAQTLIEQVDDKNKRSRNWKLKRIDGLTYFGGTFPTLLMMLDSLPVVVGNGIRIRAAEKIRVHKQTDDPLAYSVESVLNQYTQYVNTATLPENTALWIENRLIRGGLVGSMQEPITPEIAELLSIIALAQTPQESLPQRWHELGDSNRNLFAALNYGVRPLLIGLEPSESEYLEELSRACIGSPIEGVVWEYAYLFRQSIGRGLNSRDPKEIKHHNSAVADQINHTKRWLQRNGPWAYKLLESKVAPFISVKAPLNKEPEPDVTFGSTFYSREDTEQVTEDTEEIERGPLAGWRIYYRTNADSADEKYLVEIGGTTIEERIQAMDEFIQKNFPQVANAALILEELSDAVDGWDSTNEMIRKRHSEGDVKYKVRNIGGTRLLYERINPQSQNIIFCLYQKEAMAWRKRILS